MKLEIPHLIYLEPLGMTKSCQVFQAFLLIQKVSRIFLRYFCWKQHVLACDLKSKCSMITREGHRCLSWGPDESLICRDCLACFWMFLWRQDDVRRLQQKSNKKGLLGLCFIKTIHKQELPSQQWRSQKRVKSTALKGSKNCPVTFHSSLITTNNVVC